MGLDYFFITESGSVQSKSETQDTEDMEEQRKKGKVVKCIIMRCSYTKCIFAHVVPRKGVDEENVVVDMVLNDLDWLGHTRVILKSDGEPSIKAVVRRTIGLAKSECRDLQQISKEESAAYDSQSNGLTEVGIRLIRGIFRTIKLCTEDRVDKFIPVDHPLIAWMLEHSQHVLNVMVKGEDGITPWHRARGRPFRQPLISFGAIVLYRFPTKGPRHAPHGNMGPLGDEGVFLGFHKSQNSYVIGTKDGSCVFTRSITRRAERDRWNPQALADVCRTPSAPRERQEVGRQEFDGPASAQGPTAEATRQAPIRRMRINKSDLVRYGFNKDCPQCEHIHK